MSLRPVSGRGDLRSLQEQGEQPGPASWNDGRILFDQRRWICVDAEVNWVADHHLVILTEAGDTEHTLVRFNGRTVFEGRDRPGVLTFVPAGTQREGHYRNANLIYSALWIDIDLQTGLASTDERLLDKGFANGADTVVAPLIAAVGRELAAGQTPDSLYMEHVAAVILLRLAAKKGAPADHPRRGGRLSTRAVRRVEEFIEAALAGDISLHDLARPAARCLCAAFQSDHRPNALWLRP